MGLMCIFENLQERQLIPPSRDYPIPQRNLLNITCRQKRIYFDPELVKRMNDRTLIFTLLHEESHIRNPPSVVKINFGFTVIFAVVIAFLLGSMFDSQNEILIGIVLFLSTFFITLFFISPLIFLGRWHNAEYQADFEAACVLKNELGISKPSLVAEKTFHSIREYHLYYRVSMNPRHIQEYLKLYMRKLKGMINQHPSDRDRINRIRSKVDK